MNRDGNECISHEVFVCKITHQINTPDICIVDDEVGEYTSQKNDGHISGRDFTPQFKVINKKNISHYWNLYNI